MHKEITVMTGNAIIDDDDDDEVNVRHKQM